MSSSRTSKSWGRKSRQYRPSKLTSNKGNKLKSLKIEKNE